MMIAHDESSLKPPEEEQDENHYQDRPQDTAGSITPALAMWPSGEGSHQQNNDNDENNQSHFQLLSPRSQRAAPIWLKGCSGPSAPGGLLPRGYLAGGGGTFPGPIPPPGPGPIPLPGPEPIPSPMPLPML